MRLFAIILGVFCCFYHILTVAVAKGDAKTISFTDKSGNTTVFSYSPGNLCKIYCTPLAITDLQFEVGEHIITVAGGDTSRWQVSKTFSGSDISFSRRDHLLIKPNAVGLTNMLVITTDQRVYHLMLYAQEKLYMPVVSWIYDEKNENLSRNKQFLNIDNLNFSYTVSLIKGKKPDWFPEVIFNDGKKTYIRLARKTQEMPILLLNDDGCERVINYRVLGSYLIVDDLFRSAYLKMVEGRKKTFVKIVKY